MTDRCPDGHDNEDNKARRPRAVSKQVNTHFHRGINWLIRSVIVYFWGGELLLVVFQQQQTFLVALKKEKKTLRQKSCKNVAAIAAVNFSLLPLMRDK